MIIMKKMKSISEIRDQQKDWFKIVITFKNWNLDNDITISDSEAFCDLMVNRYVKLGIWYLDRMNLTKETKSWILAKWSQDIAKEVLKD